MKLRSSIENTEGALMDYGQRSQAGKPISTSLVLLHSGFDRLRPSEP